MFYFTEEYSRVF